MSHDSFLDDESTSGPEIEGGEPSVTESLESGGPAPSKKRNGMKVAFADSRSRVTAAISVALVFAVFIIFVFALGGDDSDPTEGLAKVPKSPRSLDKTTGGDESAEYTRLASEAEKSQAEAAKSEGASFVPSLVGAQRANELSDVDPLDEDLRGDGSGLRGPGEVTMGLDDVVIDEPPPLPIEEPVEEPAKEPEQEASYDESDIDRIRREMRAEFEEQAALAYQAAIARENARRAALYNGFSPEETEAQILGFSQQLLTQSRPQGMLVAEWSGMDTSNADAEAATDLGFQPQGSLSPTTSADSGASSSSPGVEAESEECPYRLASTAEVDYAVMLSRADSDIGGYVRAQIAGGPRSGAILLGTFSPTGEFLQVGFETMVIDGHAYPVDAYAVDPERGQQAAVRSSINRHIAARLSGAFLQTFADTYSAVVREAGTRVVITDEGTPIESNDGYTSEQIIAIAGADAIGEGTGVISEIFGRNTTVVLDRGAEIGVLFVDQVCSETDPEASRAMLGTQLEKVYP